MSKKTATAAAAIGAAVTQPGGMRRFAGGCLVVLVLAGLILGGTIAGLAWLAQRPSAALPCPADGPVRVSLASGAGKPGKPLTEAVNAVLSDARRTAETVTGTAQGDLRIVQAFGASDPVQTYGEAPVTLRAAAGASKAQIKAALGDRLAVCSASRTVPSQGGPARITGSPWAAATPATLSLLLAVIVWWGAGPETVRALGRACWPLRLAWRRLESRWWLWKRRRGERPMEPPVEPSRGQRWAEDPKAMRDRRSPRQQDRAAGRRWLSGPEAIRNLARQALADWRKEWQTWRAECAASKKEKEA